MTRKSKKRQIGKPSTRVKAHTKVRPSELQNIQEAISRGDLVVANQLATEFTRLNANSSQGWEMLANIQEQQQDVIGACQSMQKALECAKEKNPLSVVKLAQYELLAGKANKAIERLKNISKDAPKEKNVWVVLSRAYHLLGLNKEALEANDVAFALDADYPAMLMLRTRIFDQLKRHGEAYSAARKVKKIVPNQPGVSNYLATLSLREGDYETAEKYFNEELELGENSEAAYNSFIAKHYNPISTAEELTKIATDWQNRYLKDITAKRADTTVRKSKRIRIGLLSGGFRRHPVGQMILPALQNIDKNEAELFFYTTSQIVDHLTLEIKKTADSWTSATELSDEQLNEKIRQDQVDILIDMNGGGEGSRFMALAKEPAPLIVKWVGILINTTGLKCFDYLLSDSIETPKVVDHLYTEKLIRLPDDYICYQLPTYIPKVSSLPALKNQFITFGCLNNPAKLSDPLIQEWSKLLHEVPNSKLLLRGIQFEGSDFCQRTLSRFAECGIEAERLLLEGPDKHEEFLKTYQRIDIALDTWPYSGGLTTCEALAMGVPVVTCVGPTFAGRHSATHLANAGLPELVTDNWDDFRKRAKELAADLPSLAVIRAALRTILKESPVCDGERFAKHFTKAMRGIWQRHCEGKAPEALTFNKEGDAWFADEDQPIELVEVEAEPEPQEAEFEWSLESPITVIDNGALFVRYPRFTEWMQTGNFAVITFDPGSLLTKQADELKQLGEWHHYPHATLGDGKDTTLYATLGPELTGTLQPVEEQQTGEQDDPLRLLSTLPISTVPLNAIEGLPGIDLLILDSLNDAMAILENGHTYLANTLLLQVKLAFQPTHQRQPNLAEVQHWMARHGFRFYRFNNEQHRSYLPESVPAEKRQATELTSADAIFLPSHERMAALSHEQSMKLAFLLHTVYGIKDMAYALLAQVGEEKAEGYLVEEGLTEKDDFQGSLKPQQEEASNLDVPPPAGPPIPQREHIKGEAVVSVVCATYNHVSFIEDAIKGFIAQKTDFPFEVIIHDDASTDGTQEVIKRYAEQYPDLIRPIYQKENQYSQNRKPLDICLPLAKGRYIAICEGDDYWTDPKKLKIQFDYMERHPDCVVTHHNAFVFNSCGLVRESKLPKHCIRSYKKDELLRNDCFLLTLSMMFRKKIDKFPKEKGNVGNGDNFLISMLGLYGESAYLECVKPAAYRLHADSTWSSKTPEEKQKMLANSMKWISIYHEKRGRKDIANYYAKKAVF